MKILNLTLLCLLVTVTVNAQAEKYNLKSKNLSKKVRKTIEHYYSYDKKSGGFVKRSVSINRYNNDGNLIETFYLYNSAYSKTSEPTKKLYNYNSDDQLIGTEDVSDVVGKYSSTLRFEYDDDGNITKEETIYRSGGKGYTTYQYDKRGREIKRETYNSKGNLSSEITINHKGRKKEEINTSYSSSDGSIIGTYKTYFDDNIKTKYIANSKYSDYTTTYEYNKQGDLRKSIQDGKKGISTSKYNYVYDDDDNWVKKHYRSGKYHYFYFREIYFKNGDVSGSTEFDKRFINTHGNFENVEVVPLVKYKKEVKRNDVKVSIRNRRWNYSYVKMKEKVSKVSGYVKLTVVGGGSIRSNSKLKFEIKIDGESTNNLSYDVTSYKKNGEENVFKLKGTTTGKPGTLFIFRPKKDVKGIILDGLLTIGSGNNRITLYLED